MYQENMGNPVDSKATKQTHPAGVTHAIYIPLNRVLNCTGARVTHVEYTGQGPIVATGKLTARKKLCCPHCSYTTTAGYDTRWAETRWRHLDMGGQVLILKMLRRRLRCPVHGVLTQGVPLARPNTGFTHQFEQLTA